MAGEQASWAVANYTLYLAIATVILGAVTLAVGVIYPECRRKQERDAIRTVVMFEIDWNIEQLTDFWTRTTTQTFRDKKTGATHQRERPSLDEWPLLVLPQWKWTILDNRPELLSAALTHDELKDLYRFVGYFGELTKIHWTISDLRSLPDVAASLVRDLIMEQRKGDRNQLWERFEEVKDKIIKRGNPVA